MVFYLWYVECTLNFNPNGSNDVDIKWKEKERKQNETWVRPVKKETNMKITEDGLMCLRAQRGISR